MRAVAIAAYNRPDCFRQLLESLEDQTVPLAKYASVVSVDAGGEKSERVAEMADGFADVVLRQESNIGLNRNTYEPVRFCFEELGAEEVVYLEDDFVLSPDAFELVEWYIHNQDALITRFCSVADVALFCLCMLPGYRRKRGLQPNPEDIWLTRALFGWGFVVFRHQWRQYVQPVWSNEDLHGTWDKYLANYIRTFPGVVNAAPALSRITNTGRDQGHNVIGAKFDRMMQGHLYKTTRESSSFQLRGISDKL